MNQIRYTYMYSSKPLGLLYTITHGSCLFFPCSLAHSSPCSTVQTRHNANAAASCIITHNGGTYTAVHTRGSNIHLQMYSIPLCLE